MTWPQSLSTESATGHTVKAFGIENVRGGPGWHLVVWVFPAGPTQKLCVRYRNRPSISKAVRANIKHGNSRISPNVLKQKIESLHQLCTTTELSLRPALPNITQSCLMYHSLKLFLYQGHKINASQQSWGDCGTRRNLKD